MPVIYIFHDLSKVMATTFTKKIMQIASSAARRHQSLRLRSSYNIECFESFANLIGALDFSQ
jgi:hypothetical protein